MLEGKSAPARRRAPASDAPSRRSLAACAVARSTTRCSSGCTATTRVTGPSGPSFQMRPSFMASSLARVDTPRFVSYTRRADGAATGPRWRIDIAVNVANRYDTVRFSFRTSGEGSLVRAVTTAGRLLAAAITVVALGVGVGACGSNDSGGGGGGTSTAAAGSATASAPKCGLGNGQKASGTPIKLGAIATKQPGADFTQVPGMAKAYFDCVNDNGGINGRPVQYITETEQTNPQQVVSLVTKMWEDEKVLGFVGNMSFLDCPVNQQFYAKNNIYAIVA